MRDTHSFRALALPAFLAAGTLLGAGKAAATVVLSYETYHSAQWNQTTASPGFNTGNAQWFYAARLLTDDELAVTDATVQASTPGAVALTQTSAGELNGSSGYYATQAAFLADWGQGASHRFDVTGGNLAGEFGVINQPASFPYPSTIPVFSNFASFTSIDPSSATFEWNVWSGAPGGPSTSFMTIRQSGALLYSTFLPTSATSATVPLGILLPGSSYTVEVIFSSRVHSGLGNWNDDSSAAPGLAGFDYRTTADFTTTAVPEPHEWLAIAGTMCLLGALARRRSAF